MITLPGLSNTPDQFPTKFFITKELLDGEINSA
jgi:hypothetical protein